MQSQAPQSNSASTKAALTLPPRRKTTEPRPTLAWLNTRPEFRRWFAEWLAAHWRRLYHESLNDLHGRQGAKTLDAMAKGVPPVTSENALRPADAQLSAVNLLAKRHGLRPATRKMVLEELEWDFTLGPESRPHELPKRASAAQRLRAEVFEASDFRTTGAIADLDAQQLCEDLAWEHYPKLDPKRQKRAQAHGEPIPIRHAGALPRFRPHDRDCRLALDTVSEHFIARSIWQTASPEALKRLEGKSTLPRDDLASILVPSRKARVAQRVLQKAVRNLCRERRGPHQLARFILHVLGIWPDVKATESFDLAAHFNLENRRMVVGNFLGLTKSQVTDEARRLWHVLHAIVYREELRTALLLLARADEGRRRKRLRAALVDLFKRIHHATHPSVKERLESLRLAADSDVRRRRAKGAKEKDIVALGARKLKLEHKTTRLHGGAELTKLKEGKESLSSMWRQVGRSHHLD